jgi:DeoR/GlpR family transcriptional regulator of sugar metabolism
MQEMSPWNFVVKLLESEVKKTLMAISRKTVALIDSSKWTEVALSPFASVKVVKARAPFFLLTV